MSADDTEKRDTRSEAAALCAHLDTLEMAFMAKFWDTILSRFQPTSIILQKTDIDLATAVRALESLCDFVSAQKGLFNNFELQALKCALNKSYFKFRFKFWTQFQSFWVKADEYY